MEALNTFVTAALLYTGVLESNVWVATGRFCAVANALNDVNAADEFGIAGPTLEIPTKSEPTNQVVIGVDGVG